MFPSHDSRTLYILYYSIEMAEAIHLGASVLTLIVVAAKLPRTTAILNGSIQDAPGDVQRVQAQLKALEFILAQMDRTYTMNLVCVGVRQRRVIGLARKQS